MMVRGMRSRKMRGIPSRKLHGTPGPRMHGTRDPEQQYGLTPMRRRLIPGKPTKHGQRDRTGTSRAKERFPQLHHPHGASSRANPRRPLRPVGVLKRAAHELAEQDRNPEAEPQPGPTICAIRRPVTTTERAGHIYRRRNPHPNGTARRP
jgi:hypothetical protein